MRPSKKQKIMKQIQKEQEQELEKLEKKQKKEKEDEAVKQPVLTIQVNELPNESNVIEQE